MSTAEKLIKRGKQEGKQDGIKEGRKEGMKEGRQEGKQEIALKMIEQGFTDETIAEITELPISEIRKLRK